MVIAPHHLAKLEKWTKWLPASWFPFRESLKLARKHLHETAHIGLERVGPPAETRLEFVGFHVVEAFLPEEFDSAIETLKQIFPFLQREAGTDLIGRLEALAKETTAGSLHSVGAIFPGQLADRLTPFPLAYSDQLPVEVDQVEVVVEKSMPSLISVHWIIHLNPSVSRELEELTRNPPIPPLEDVGLRWSKGGVSLARYRAKGGRSYLQELILRQRMDIQRRTEMALGIGVAARGSSYSRQLLPAIDLFKGRGLPEHRDSEAGQWLQDHGAWLELWGVSCIEVFTNERFLVSFRSANRTIMRRSLVYRSSDSDDPDDYVGLLHELAPATALLAELDNLQRVHRELRGRIRGRARGGQRSSVRSREATEIASSVAWGATTSEILESEYGRFARFVTGKLQPWEFLQVPYPGSQRDATLLSVALDRRIRDELSTLVSQLSVLQRWWATYVGAVAIERSDSMARLVVALSILALVVALLQFYPSMPSLLAFLRTIRLGQP